MTKLPDEILVMIAQKCIEPYSLKSLSVDGVHRVDFNPFKNIQLANKLFATEIRKALQQKFTGQLALNEGASEFVNKRIAMATPQFADILDQVTEVHLQLNSEDNHEVQSLDYPALLKLQRLVIHMDAGDLEPDLKQISIEVSELYSPNSPRFNFHHVLSTHVIACQQKRFFWLYVDHINRRLDHRVYGIDVDITLRAELPALRKGCTWKYTGKLCDRPTENSVQRIETQFG